MSIKEVFKRITCKHDDLLCISNIHGDLINIISPVGGITRSVWICKKCGAIKYASFMDPNCKITNFSHERIDNK